MLAHLLLSAHTLPTPRFIYDIYVVVGVVVVATVITLVYPSGKLADFYLLYSLRTRRISAFCGHIKETRRKGKGDESANSNMQLNEQSHSLSFKPHIHTTQYPVCVYIRTSRMYNAHPTKCIMHNSIHRTFSQSIEAPH